MLGYIAKRMAQNLVVFFLFLTLTYVILWAQPGDIANTLALDPNLPPEARDILRERLGLDKPLWQQYLTYIKNFFTGDLGFSFQQYPKEVSELIWERLPRTLVLFLTATILSYYVGFIAGKFLAWRRGKFSEYAVTVGGVTLFTVFYPWFAIIMIWVFGFILGWLPLGRFLTSSLWRGVPFGSNQVFITMTISAIVASLVLYGISLAARRLESYRVRRLTRLVGWAVVLGGLAYYWWGSPMRPYAADIGRHLLLPVLTLTLVTFAGVMLLTRTSMLETMSEDYVLTARAKGLSERAVRDRHAARNALLPVVTSLVIALAFVIAGGIVTESVFSWPGMGQLLLQGAVNEDIPVVIGSLAYIGVLALVGHLAVDILYTFLDPRIRYQ